MYQEDMHLSILMITQYGWTLQGGGSINNAATQSKYFVIRRESLEGNFFNQPWFSGGDILTRQDRYNPVQVYIVSFSDCFVEVFVF